MKESSVKNVEAAVNSGYFSFAKYSIVQESRGFAAVFLRFGILISGDS